MLVEIGIYTGFIVFLFLYCKSPSRLLSVAGFSVSSIILEIMNITVFHKQGTVYPESLFYFPGYRFPVAIILLSAIYGGIICLIAVTIVKIINLQKFQKTLFILIVMGLNLLSVFIEKAGVMSGYWIHKKAVNIYEIWYFIYLFYFAVILGGIVFLFDEIKKKS